jgi:hypothetical protein
MSVAFWTASVTGIYQYFHQIREFIHTFNRDRATVERRLAHPPTTAGHQFAPDGRCGDPGGRATPPPG